MKSVNRKLLLTLFGVVLAAPFLVIASVVGAHTAALADSLRADLFFGGLALASVAVSMANGRMALTGRTERAERGCVETKDNTDLRGTSTMSLGY